jgi:hypothetical protein
MLRIFVAGIGASMLVLTLAACSQNSRIYSAGPSVSNSDQEMAKAQCRVDATNNHGGPGAFFPIAEAIYKDNVADDCMLSQGWRHTN